MPNILQVENLSVNFEKNSPVIHGVNFSVEKGDVVAIVGPNGAGKSVLFRAILGLVPYSGIVNWTPGIKINYVPQKMSIEKDVPLTLEEFLSFKEKDETKISEMLRNVGLENITALLKHRVGWLSGGQWQRVMIAWALLDNPDVLLFDEPTSGIDVGGEETIYNLLHRLKQNRELTLLMISHDLNIVYKYANNVVCINKEMVCYGAPQMVLDPESLSKLYGGEVGFYKHEHTHE